MKFKAWKFKGFGSGERLLKTQMRRQTHAFCRNCCQNLQEYGQVRCDRCLVELKDSRLCWHSCEKLPWRQKIPCVFESWYQRMKSRVAREEVW